ncbi:MAG: YidC/Oxa1 family membrane protein insertase [Clostridiales bacterium]|nr:YidC/Oxa1 family membrane protein insertase [Clostridiales bacterium]
MDSLYRILAMPLNWFYNISGNYVIAMILYGLLIKLVLFPFGVKQQKSMLKQASMRPKEMAIRKRYAGRDDKKTQMKMQEELQKLYQSEGYNPMSGCGPALIQLPVIWILYRIVYGPMLYILGIGKEVCQNMANYAGEIAGRSFNYKDQLQWMDVVAKNFDDFKQNVAGFSDHFASEADFTNFVDKFKIFGIDLTQKPQQVFGEWTGAAIAIVAIPVLVFLAQYISMKVTRKMSYQAVQDMQNAASMKILDIGMPLMTLYMAFIFPALLGIYWIENSLLAMVQQIILKKMYPIPVFTEEDYKKAEKELAGKRKAAKKAGGSVKKHNPNSLHHIDDDDEDEPEGNAKENKTQSKEAGSQAKKKKNSLIEPAPIKDEPADEKQEKPSENEIDEA